MEDIFETRAKLNELSNRIEEYKACHKDILTTKDEYIALREKKPKKKTEKNVKRPFKSAPFRIALLIVLLLCLAFCATWSFCAFVFYCIGIVGGTVIEIIATVFVIISLVICSLGAWGIALDVFLLIGEVIYSCLSKHFYQRAQKKYEEHKKYNEEVFPDLLAKYEEREKELSCEYDILVHKAEHKIDTDEDFFKEKGDLIARKYYLDLDRIIEAIDTQRAQELNDAINLVIRDKRLEEGGHHIKKEKHQKRSEELYPADIMERARVYSRNCKRCPKKDLCIQLWCRMNEHFKREDEEELDRIIFEEEGQMKIDALEEDITV